MICGSNTALHAFLRLVRAPNLLSAPGDPLTGFCLALAAGGAAHGRAAPWSAAVAAALASVAAYAGGMIDNDLCDLEEDRTVRPERPLPSGEFSMFAARTWRGALLALPLLAGAALLPLAWIVADGLLVVAILAYNRVKAHARVPGFALMGLCRGLSLLCGAAVLGADAVLAPPVAVAACVWTGYIAGVTAFASTENGQGPGIVRYLLLLPHGLAVLAGAVLVALGARGGQALAIVGTAGWLAAGGALWTCGPHAVPAVVRPTVGRLIRALFAMQLFACASAGHVGGVVAALLLAAGWPLASRLSRRYAAS